MCCEIQATAQIQPTRPMHRTDGDRTWLQRQGAFIKHGAIPGVACLGSAASLIRYGFHNQWVVWAVFTLAFLFFRDGMSPADLWRIGSLGEGGRPHFWIRFPRSCATMLMLGLSSVGVVVFMHAMSPELAGHIAAPREPAVIAWVAAGCVGWIIASIVPFINRLFDDRAPKAAQHWGSRDATSTFCVGVMSLGGTTLVESSSLWSDLLALQETSWKKPFSAAT